MRSSSAKSVNIEIYSIFGRSIRDDDDICDSILLCCNCFFFSNRKSYFHSFVSILAVRLLKWQKSNGMPKKKEKINNKIRNFWWQNHAPSALTWRLFAEYEMLVLYYNKTRNPAKKKRNKKKNWVKHLLSSSKQKKWIPSERNERIRWRKRNNLAQQWKVFKLWRIRK